MNPAQLLNPKAFAKEAKKKKKAPNYGPRQSRRPQPSEGSESAPKPTNFDYRALLNPKAAAQQSAKGAMSNETDINGHGGATDGLGTPSRVDGAGENGNEVGFSKFANGIHRTTEREAVNERKRKPTDDAEDGDEEQKKAKSTFNGGGSSGMLGEHLRDQRKKRAVEAGPQPNNGPIDLTEDNDDDIQIIGETRNNSANIEVCLGMLRCQAGIFRVPFTGTHLAKEWWPPMKVTMSRVQQNDHIIDLSDRRGTKFGRLSPQVARALSPLMDGAHISKLRTKAHLDKRPRVDNEQIGDSVSQQIQVLIHLYAPRRSADQIGRYLSQRQLFLESAVHVDSGKEIFNPQVPKPYATGAPRTQTGQSYGSVTRTVEEMKRDASSMFDSLTKTEQLPEKEADENFILTPLMSHQKQALHFLTDHENYDQNTEEARNDDKYSLWKHAVRGNGREAWYNVITGQELKERPSPVYGGILADMMGLGKTLSILSLVASTVNESEAFRKLVPPASLAGVERNGKATLIICPTSVLSNWQEQIGNHIVFGKLNWYVYHGPSRTQDVRELSKYDIVLTTYGTVSSEVSDSLKKKKALTSLQWFRVVLDEAHTIRNTNTRNSKGACALHAQRRWAVTGTPVQNRLDDLGALIRFLRIKPFDEPSNWSQYIMAPFKNANMEVLTHLRLLVDSITLRRMKDNIDLPERKEGIVRLEMTESERQLYGNFAGQSNRQLKSMMQTAGRLRGKTYAHVLKSLLRLRMICDHGREMLSEEDLKDIEGMDISNAIDLGDEPELDTKYTFISERAAYEVLHLSVEANTDICQLCDKSIISKHANAAEAAGDDTESSSEDEDDDEVIGAMTTCYHIICADCKSKQIATIKPPELRPDGYHNCLLCEAYVRFAFFDYTRGGYEAYVDEHTDTGKKVKRAMWNADNYSGPHTKVRALIEELDKSANETAALQANTPADEEPEPPIRSVVFTEWTSYLDLIEFALQRKNISYVRLDGRMNVKQRSKVLETFRTDPTVTVLLVSIRAGGQGLNFTVASKVYMMEPQFNPGVEQQAIDRVHRLGQKRSVEITHFVMRDSVEESILKLQEKKTKLAQLSMEKKMTRSEEAQKRLEELRELFK